MESMANYFEWYEGSTDLTGIYKWGDNNPTTTLNSGDLIKIPSQLMPLCSDNWLIVLYTISNCDNDARNTKLEVIDDNVLAYLIVETNLSSRLKVYHNMNRVTSLKVNDLINIYLKSTTEWELKICCTIDHIGEVLEYGKGVYFAVRVSQSFKFPKNPQHNIIKQYVTGSHNSAIILTASTFFEQTDFNDITNRSILATTSVKSNSEIDEIHLKFAKLKQRLLSLEQVEISKSPDEQSQSENVQLQHNLEPLACSICREECVAHSGIQLNHCRHFFCSECLTKHVSVSVGDVILCPFINKTYKCNSTFEVHKLSELNLDESKSPIETNETKQFVQCVYCFDICNRIRIFTLSECNHNICNNCLMIYLEHQSNSKLKCPVKICEYMLTSQDILEIFIQLDAFYIKNSMSLFEICIKCQVPHPNITCNQFHLDLKTNEDAVMMRLKNKYDQLVGIGEAVHCTKCEIVIITQGHDKAVCSTCEAVCEANYQLKPWKCGVCCNTNNRDSNLCRFCGKDSKIIIFSENKIPTTVSCTFCITDVKFTDGGTLNCSHFFCTKCLATILRTKEPIISCPYDQNNSKCLAQIEDFEVLHIMGENVYEQYRKRMEPTLYDILVTLDDNPLILNTVPFECIYCMSNCDVGQGVLLRECLHEICKECIVNHIKSAEQAEVKCPFILIQDWQIIYKCDSIIEDREIKAIDEEIFNQYIDRRGIIGKMQLVSGFQCKTVNCNGFWENVGDVNTQECPNCKAINCINCQAIHPDMKCDEYQSTAETKNRLEDEIARGIGMRCPKCQIIIIRDDGCDWLVCTMCQTEICWATKGPRWGPNGRGDVSGGCKCLVDGQKCHPECKYCH